MRRYLSTGFAEQVGKNLGESVSKCKKLFGWVAIGFFVLFFWWSNLSRKNSSLVRRIVRGVSHRQFPVIGTSPGTCHGFPPHSHPEGAHVVRQEPRCGKTFHLISNLVPATARGGSAVYNAPRFTVTPVIAYLRKRTAPQGYPPRSLRLATNQPGSISSQKTLCETLS